MTDIRDLLTGAVAADARATNGDVLADALYSSTRHRVRTRRGVRAAGMGSMAAVSVGALALGAAHLPGVRDAQPGLPSSSASAQAGCPPGSWWVDPALSLFDFVGESSPGVPGVAVQPMAVQGEEVTVFLDDTTGEVMAMVVPATVGAADEVLQARISADEALTVAADIDGAFTFELDDGRWLSVDAEGRDALALTAAQPNTASASMAPDEGVAWDDASAELAHGFPFPWPESPWVCVSPNGEGDPTEVETSASPSAGIDSATASSPYQCGYVLPADERLPEEWAIVEQEWMSPEDAWADVSAGYSDSIDTSIHKPSAPVLRLEATGTFHDGPGLHNAERGFEDPGAPRFIERFESWNLDEGYDVTSLSLVAVKDRVVVGVINEDTYREPPSGVTVKTPGQRLEGDPPNLGLEFFLLDDAELLPCDGFTGDLTEATLYGVSGGTQVAADGTVTGPIYGWQEIVRP